MKVTEYKLLFEEEKKAAYELKEGIDDLNYRLSFFFASNSSKQNRTVKDSIENLNQKNHDQKNALSILEEAKKEKKANHPKEIKKLHRKIVSYIHPDKLTNVPDDILAKYKEYYHLATLAWKEKEYSNIVMIADSLLISINDKLIYEYIDPGIISLKQKIIDIKNNLGYHWYHIKEEEKDNYFKIILDNCGFKYTDEEVKDVIKKPVINRKTGTRPKNLNRRRKINGKHKNNPNS